jgi:hypothetical protein
MRFEANFTSYARQRSRWLGGMLVHAFTYGRWYEAAVVMVFYVVGHSAILLPLSVPVLGRAALSVWFAGLTCAALNRIRYLRFTSERLDLRLRASTYLASFWFAPRDIFALAYAPYDMLVRLGTKAW